MNRLFLPLLIPLAAAAATAAVVVGIGELFLAVADLRHELLGMKEPYAVILALLLAAAILAVASLLASRGRRTHE